MPQFRIRRSTAAVGLAASVAFSLACLAPMPVGAQTQPPTQQKDDPAVLAREAIEMLMRALSAAIENLPQYAMPEINERGDIIIRRLNPRAEQPPPERTPEYPDATRT